jgi:hypothetical protein
VVRTDEKVIKDHDYLPAPNFQSFLRQVYYSVLGEQDRTMTQLLVGNLGQYDENVRRSVAGSPGCP